MKKPRRIYMALNETPLIKENPMNKIAVAKLAAVVTVTIVINIAARVAVAKLAEEIFDVK